MFKLRYSVRKAIFVFLLYINFIKMKMVNRLYGTPT